jgi:hypothetical protein
MVSHKFPYVSMEGNLGGNMQNKPRINIIEMILWRRIIVSGRLNVRN